MPITCITVLLAVGVGVSASVIDQYGTCTVPGTGTVDYCNRNEKREEGHTPPARGRPPKKDPIGLNFLKD